MTSTIYSSNFRTLRQAYVEVKRFIEENSFDTVTSLNTRIEEDLGMSGDDNYNLLVKFVKKYKLDVLGFDYNKHFLSEGEIIFDPGIMLYSILIALPFWIIFWLVRLLTFGHINYTQEQIMPSVNRQTLDMTFGDLLVWYLTGKYQLRKEVDVHMLPSNT